MIVNDIFGLVFIFSAGTTHGIRGRDTIREAGCGNTPVTASIEACPVLLQSTSSRSRFDRRRWEDDSVDVKRHSSSTRGRSPDEASFLSIWSSSLTLSTLAHLRNWRLSGITYVIAHGSSVVFIVVVVMLLAITSVVVWLLQPHPFLKGGGAESALRSTESLGQTKNEPRCYSRADRSTESVGQYSRSPPRQSFCPELVVPVNSECMLTLPWQEWSHSRFAACDPYGKAVLNVQQSEVGGLWTATVTSEASDVIAICRETRSPDVDCMSCFGKTSHDAPVFEFIPTPGAPCWAKMVYNPEGERFLLSPNRGPVWHFWGKFEDLAVNITDEDLRLFATTELQSVEHDPTGRMHCRLRVAPKADVGMALLGILCVGRHLATQPKLH